MNDQCADDAFRIEKGGRPMMSRRDFVKALPSQALHSPWPVK